MHRPDVVTSLSQEVYRLLLTAALLLQVLLLGMLPVVGEWHSIHSTAACCIPGRPLGAPAIGLPRLGATLRNQQARKRAAKSSNVAAPVALVHTATGAQLTMNFHPHTCTPPTAAGPLLGFLGMAWLYALYCFDYKWGLHSVPLEPRLRFFEQHWDYFAGGHCDVPY